MPTEHPPPAIAPDALFTMLSNERRRLVIEHFAAAGEARTQTELAKAIAATEHECPPADVTSRQYKAVYVTLHQGHLSRLDGVGLVEYDVVTGTVAPTALTAPVAEYIERGERLAESGRLSGPRRDPDPDSERGALDRVRALVGGGR